VEAAKKPLTVPQRLLTSVDKVILHCADSATATFDDIKRWHVKERGWTDIGYNYVIEKSGEIKAGRPLELVPAHCEGHNVESIGICLAGKDMRDFTKQQFVMALRLINGLNMVLGKELSIHGHREFNKFKSCPNFDVNDLVKLAHG
jgi:N-acetylmuramoyl-L-alanine amidase.